MRLVFIAFFLLGFFLSFQVFALNAPVKLAPVQATFKKITIKWQSGDSGQVYSYKVYRNDSEIATVSDPQYTDSNLNTGTQYIYKVVAVGSGGATSSPSAALTVKTIKSVTFDNSTEVEQVVDSLHPASAGNLTGITLLSAVKSGLEALLGSSITFSSVDSDILTNFIEQELTIIKEVEPAMTDAERLAAQTELDTTLSSGFGGNSFEHVYIQSKLSELAEEHYQKGHKTGAAALYEFSLNYLKDQESVVFGTLARLAAFKIDALTDTSTQLEISAALADYKNTFVRFFDFFPNSVSMQAQSACSMVANKYFRYFPVILNYDSYDSAAFNSALQLAQSALQMSNDAMRQKLYNRIAAWELVPETMEFKDSNGNPLTGSITVKDITATTPSKDIFPGDPYEEERTIQVVSGQANFPVYKGHIYTAIVHFNVTGGNALNYTIDTFAHEKGKTVTYNNFSSPVTENTGSGYAKSSFVFDQPNYPYNLTYERAIDVFTLHWQWVAPAGFALKNFKVFCGGTVVATVTGTTATNIPILPDEGVHFYTVVAYDVNDSPSASSQAIFVVRDSARYADYFAWMKHYFGDQPMYSCDDPNFDGTDNYHEYLNGTNPTQMPGPIMHEGGQIGYSKAVLNWDQAFAGEAGISYKIYRNGTEVGTSSTTTFTDTGLTPGLSFTYQIKAVKQDGTDTRLGAQFAVKTILPVTFNGSDKVQQVVDSLIPANAAQYTGSTLISAVKSGIEALSGSTVTFSTVSNDILNNFVTQELAIINEVTPSMTDAERLAAKTELTTMLNDNFGGNSFEHVYIHGKLSELAEEYYQKGDKEMGTALYELSLNYLKNVESSVSGSLSRLATFKLDTLTDTSTNEQIAAALDAYRDTYLRFFIFFPNSTSMQAQTSYTMPTFRYFKYFPALLKYDSYNQSVFNSARQLSEAALALNNDAMGTARHSRIAAWALSNMKVTVENPDGEAVTGSLIVRNTSKNLFPDDSLTDERQFQLTGAQLSIPVYAGHTYDLAVSFDVSGGAPIRYNIAGVAHTAGQKIVYDHFNNPVAQSLPEGNASPEVIFITGKPQCPYNLSSQLLPDEFALSWDWTAPNTGYQLKYFKVYRGGTEIGTVTQQQMTHIPRILAADSSYVYTVVAYDINDTPSQTSPALVVLPNFTADDQKYFAWKLKYFGNTPILASDDPDGDGLTNFEEYLLGSDPTQAPQADPKSALQNIKQGIKVSYYNGAFSAMPDFSVMTPAKTDIINTFYMSNNYDVVLTSGQKTNVAAVFSAYFDAPVDGKYRFYMVSDDGARLFIDNAVVIEDKSNGWSDAYAEISLTQGTHAFKLQYYQIADRADLQLYWAGPNFTQKIMDSSVFWYTTDNEKALAEVIAWQRDSDHDGVRDIDEMKYKTKANSVDSDGDGLTDYEEIYIYHTDPNKADTDGDGISDFDEVKVAFTDPNKADFNGTSTILQNVDGSSYAQTSSGWEKDGAATYCTARNGWAQYGITIPQKGIYVLEIEGGEYNSMTTSSVFNLDLYVNNQLSGSTVLKVQNQQAGTVRFFLPELDAGTVTAKIVWNNVQTDTYLKINSLKLKQLGGPDTNNTGKPDWVVNRLNNMCLVTIPASSKISPLFIEGKNAEYMNSISLSVEGIPATGATSHKFPWYDSIGTVWLAADATASQLEGLTRLYPVPAHGAKNTWYADLPLYPEGPSAIAVSMQSGAKSVQQNVEWTPTNILLESDMTVRAGDSLRLTAHPVDNIAGLTSLSVNSESFTLNGDACHVYKFDNPGNYTVTATFTPESGEPVSKTITVKAVGASFAGAPYAVVGLDRNWSNPSIPSEAVLEYDDSITVYCVAQATKGYNISFYGKKAGDAWITARLGENGPVMAGCKIDILDCRTHKSDGYYKQIETFRDGSMLIEGQIALSEIPADLKIVISIYTAGTTFEDGTITKTLTAADFDATGICRYRMLKSATSATATCSGISLYQGNTFIQSYRNW